MTRSAKKAPSIKNIDAVWQEILAEEKEEKSDAVKEISLLSSAQKSVLLHIAQDGTRKLTGKKTILALQLASSTILIAIDLF